MSKAFVVDEKVVATGFAAEFVLFVISCLITPYIWGGYAKVSRSKQLEGKAYMASLFHSIWATGVSAYLFWVTREDHTPMIYRGQYTVDGVALSLACGTILGHLVTDALYSIVFRKAMDEYNMFWQMMLHHVLFILAIAGNFYFCIFLPLFWTVYIGELSSIFLAIRWFMIRSGNTKTVMFTAMNFFFALTFFLTRVVMLVHMTLQCVMDYELILEKSPLIQQISILGIVPCVCMLNLYWFISFSTKACSKREESKKEK